MTVLPKPTPTPSSTRPITTMETWTAPAESAAPARKASAAAAMSARRPCVRVRREAASDDAMPAM